MREAEMFVEELGALLEFLSSLKAIDPGILEREIAPDEWSVHDIVAHIMMWDKNFVEKTGPALLKGDSVPPGVDIDGQAFNDQAVEYGKHLDHNRLLEDASRYRSKLLQQLAEMPDKAFQQLVGGTNSRLPLSALLRQEFVLHDRQHIEQIKAYLKQQGIELGTT